MRPPRPGSRLILLLLSLNPALRPTWAFVHMPASPERAGNSSIELDLLECNTPFDLEKTTLQVLNWQCCAISENDGWKCLSPDGAVVAFSTDKNHEDRACYRLTSLRVGGVRFSFRSSSRAKCIEEVNLIGSTTRIHSEGNSTQLRLQTELVSLMGTAAAGEEHMWSALRELHTLPHYSLRAVQVWGTAGAAKVVAALADEEEPAWAGAFARLEKLTVMDAQLGGTLRLPTLPALRELRVERCGLSDIHFQQDPWRLRELHVSGNRLSSLPAAAVASRVLRVLNASSNAELRVSARTLASLPAALERLDLSGVAAVGALLAREPFPPLAALVSLALDACGVRAFAPAPAPAPFARLALLQELSLADNGLAEWPRRGGGGGARHIARLDLSRNALASIPAGSLQASETLAADNFISQWDADAFSLSVAVRLDLRRNRLTAIRGDMLRALRSQWGLRHLLLQGNPLSCAACEVRDFAKWLNNQPHLDRRTLQELTCLNGDAPTPLLETSVDCKEPTWILELFIPVCAFLLLGGVFCAIWLIWRKEIAYMMEIAHLKPVFVWPGHFYRNS